jgi:hypothetical protein
MMRLSCREAFFGRLRWKSLSGAAIRFVIIITAF